jgi:hypothetical protein
VTRFKALHELLTGERVLTDAERRVGEAAARAEAAYQRGDDRDYGRAMMDLQAAQNDRLRRGE